MEKIIKYSLISLILFSFIPLFAQSQVSDSLSFSNDNTISDSTLEIPKYRLHLNPYLMEKRFFLSEKDYFLPDMEIGILPEEQTETAQPKSMEELKHELNVYMNMQRDQLPNYNLGKFTEYMTYGTTAAAVLLAIMHISKYGFK